MYRSYSCGPRSSSTAFLYSQPGAETGDVGCQGGSASAGLVGRLGTEDRVDVGRYHCVDRLLVFVEGIGRE